MPRDGRIVPLAGVDGDYGRLVDAIGDARFVLLGEATHGTHEFYAARTAITRRLVEEKGFSAVVVEADWPDAWRVNRYVRGGRDDAGAAEALGGFKRFPTWMWRNRDVLELVEWMRRHNASATTACGFYGMDLYSLYRSIDEVLLLLGRLDPEAARRARDRYGCFEQYLDDPQRYGYAASFDMTRSCQEQVLQQLREISRRGGDPEDRFFLEQNARLVADAEAYYRAMFASREASWNLRDTHMAGTVDALAAHLEETSGAPARLVLWAHNSHLGDARATEMGWSGEHNVGQLLRYRHGDAVFNVGFTTHKGRVTAARDWGEPPRHLHVQPSLPGSHERLLHEVGEGGDFFLVTRGAPDPARMFGRRLERAIGVIYRPETERWSHYFEADLATQFDAVVHFDVTHAVEPLERMQVWDPDRAETFPTGL